MDGTVGAKSRDKWKNLVAALEQKWNTEGERRQQGWSLYLLIYPYYDICFRSQNRDILTWRKAILVIATS